MSIVIIPENPVTFLDATNRGATHYHPQKLCLYRSFCKSFRSCKSIIFCSLCFFYVVVFSQLKLKYLNISFSIIDSLSTGNEFLYYIRELLSNYLRKSWYWKKVLWWLNEDFMINERLIVVKIGHQSCSVCSHYGYLVGVVFSYDRKVKTTPLG